MSREYFEDVDHFASSLRPAKGRYLQTGRSEARWWVEQLDFGRATVQAAQVGAGSVFSGVTATTSFAICLPIHLRGPVRVDGRSMDPNSFIVTGGGRATTISVGGPNTWFTVTFSGTDSLDEATQAILSRSLKLNKAAADFCDKAGGNLRGMARRLLSHEAQLTPAAVDSAEREVLETLLVLPHAERESRKSVGRQRFSRPQLIAKCFEYCHSHEGQSVSIADLCSNLNLTDRTLRNVFYDYFGVAPIRFLKLRQLHEINRKLMRASPQEETVTAIASAFGVWDFAQFARQYRSIFLERPSETLRRSAPSAAYRRHGFTQPWISFALKCISDRA
jgi:AraC family transcriptional regulator, ethanolamine operon transcriptional activator